VWPCIACGAADNGTLKNISPKLKQFLTDHPVASLSLTQISSEAFGNRKFAIYYFYNEDESVARSFHYYPNSTSVTIVIRENQPACDEYICLLFEILNSEGEPRFQQLLGMAKKGTISRVDYATEVLKQEFISVKRTRDMIATFGLSPKEIEESYYYDKFVRCPNDFTSFLSYRLKTSSDRDALRAYERYYDTQKQYHDPLNEKSESTNASPTTPETAVKIKVNSTSQP
jgi:hypothetical protein